MFPIILERDTPIIDWPTYQLWCTSLSNPFAGSLLVRSDGILKLDSASIDANDDTGVITSDLATCIGLHLTGPEPGTELTPYSVSCVAASEDPDVRPFLFVAESPASITSAAGGNTVTDVRYLGFGNKNTLDKEVTIVAAENTLDRGICFGVGMWGHGGPGADEAGMVRLCVRRLIAPGPRVVDTRKL